VQDQREEGEKIPLVAIVGPTGVGKTEVSIRLAEHMEGEIVSADSRLFYRGMDIGTAKPTWAERRGVPHHLIDIAEPDQNLSLADFQRLARQIIAEIHEKNHLPFLVGGTGQYVRAVIEEWDVPRVEPDPHMRRALERWAEEIGGHGLHARLAVLDPQAASGIDPRNLRRTVRALEVILRTGKRFSEQRKRSESPYRVLLLGLNRPRPELYQRIDARIQTMLDTGLVAETRHLLDLGYSPALPAMSAIGYREIVAYLQGSLSLEEAVMQIKHNTRVFVRRQANWFKPHDPVIRWFQAGNQVTEEMKEAIREWLQYETHGHGW
jgi:tRNA dimethylallyltransferase